MILVVFNWEKSTGIKFKSFDIKTDGSKTELSFRERTNLHSPTFSCTPVHRFRFGLRHKNSAHEFTSLIVMYYYYYYYCCYHCYYFYCYTLYYCYNCNFYYSILMLLLMRLSHQGLIIMLCYFVVDEIFMAHKQGVLCKNTRT